MIIMKPHEAVTIQIPVPAGKLKYCWRAARHSALQSLRNLKLKITGHQKTLNKTSARKAAPPQVVRAMRTRRPATLPEWAASNNLMGDRSIRE
jgi:hypothetical protein